MQLLKVNCSVQFALGSQLVDKSGREVLCDFKLIAKAWVRIGNTHMRLAARAEGFANKEPHYKEAIETYGKSLLENYTNDGSISDSLSLAHQCEPQHSIVRRRPRLSSRSTMMLTTRYGT